MAELPFFPLATDAYLADCAHLDDAETGRYFQLLIALWRAPNQRLPNDDDWLARKFRRDPGRVKSELRPLILEFCQNDGNWITQKRISREYKRALKTVHQRRDAANARWLKNPVTKIWPAETAFANPRWAKEKTDTNAYAPTLIPTPIHSSLSKSLTDAARDPAQVGGSGPRASRPQTMKERMAALAALNRRKFLA